MLPGWKLIRNISTVKIPDPYQPDIKTAWWFQDVPSTSMFKIHIFGRFLGWSLLVPRKTMGKTPEQVGALCNTMGDQRSSSLYVGAVKTNVSHLEGAAGIAGLLKVPWLVTGGEGGGCWILA